VETEPTAGEFMTPIPEGKVYTIQIEPKDSVNYAAQLQKLDTRTVSKGDTVRMPVVKLRRIVRPIILTGTVSDGKGKALQADISFTEKIDDMTEAMPDLVTTHGADARYEKRYGFGKYLLTFVDPTLQDDYIPLATEVDIRSAKQGDTIIRDFVLNPMPKEVTVFGNVTALQPTPKVVDNASITAVEISTNTKLAETRTASNGTFRLTLPKGRSVGISIQSPEYYPDTTYLQLPKRDTTTQQELNVSLVWKNIIITGSVEAEKTGVPVPSASIIVQRDSTGTILTQVTTENTGRYRMIVPKETPLRFTAQSSEYFFSSRTAFFRKEDTSTVTQNFRLPEALTLRINFPTDEFSNPTPFILDSNGLPTTTRWQDELDRVATNILMFKDFLGVITVTGHTDDVSSDDYNLKLGQRRAEFVVTELVKRSVPQDKLRAQSQGERQLLSRRPSESIDLYRARCRRVELTKAN
ncbi:MAG: OmpA family protein, partial [Candidatus Kapabacteria bacterium]|nr:OmpA family protein [Candidatus Kapabacteria bacterium]